MPEMNANDKVLALFHYINEFSNLKQKTIRNIRDQFWCKYLADIPCDERYITINKRNTSEATEFDGILLEVIKPELKSCPTPDIVLQDWLIPGWENPLRDIALKEFKESGKQVESPETEVSIFTAPDVHDKSLERFEDSDIRVKAYEHWKTLRDPWAEEQKQLIKIRDLFTSLYKLHVTLERDTDSKELLVGCGFLTDTHSSDLQHPILAKRVQTEFDSLNNTIRIVDTEVSPELYTALITSVEDFNLGVLPRFTDQLSVNAFHPLNEEDTPEFLQQLIHSLSSDSQYLDGTEVQKTERFQLVFRPVFFVRDRNDGTPKAIEAIISDIKENGHVPSHILNLVGDGQIQVEEDTTEKTLSEQLAEVGGEDIDILLTKPANKEQLEIARRISKYDAVLVQGPPGTGKTHTIANLLGHFLSQGKTVLVTSHTKKALTVVKEKVETDLQDLCVAVLDENNTDMEKSVDGLTEMISRYPLYELQDRITEAADQRKQIIQRLAQVRQHIFEMRPQKILCNRQSMTV